MGNQQMAYSSPTPESEAPDPLLPGKFHAPPSSSSQVLHENDSISIENNQNSLQNTINESLGKKDKLCNENVLSLQQTANEGVNNLKESCLKNDSPVPLPCPEECEVLKDTTINENVKAFELTPKDVQTIKQSANFEILCDSKEIGSFQSPLKTEDKCKKNNCDEDALQDPEDIKAINTSKIKKAGEEILEQTTSYLEKIACKRGKGVKKENATKKRLPTTSNIYEPTELNHRQLNLKLATKQNAILELNETEKSNKQEIHQDKLKSNVLDHLRVHLPEELHIVPPIPENNYMEASLEHGTSINRTLDEIQLLSVVNTEQSQDKKIQEQTIKESASTAIRREQEDAVCISNVSSVDPTGGLDVLPICNKEILSIATPKDIMQDSVVSKGSQQEKCNIGELDFTNKNLETSPHSVQTEELTTYSEEKCSILNPMLNLGNSKTENVDISTITPTKESFQNDINSPSVPSTGILKDESKSFFLETENFLKMKHCANVNYIPPIDEFSKVSVPSLGDKILSSYNSETNLENFPKDLGAFNISLKEIEKFEPFEKEAKNHYQNEEKMRKSVEFNSSVIENLSISPTSVTNDTPFKNIASEIPKNTKCSSINSSVDVQNVEIKSFYPEIEKHIESEQCEKVNDITSVDKFSDAAAKHLLEVDKKPLTSTSDNDSMIRSKHHDIFNITLEESMKFKHLEEGAVSNNLQIQEKARIKSVDDCSQMKINKSLVENVDTSSADISNDLSPTKIEKKVLKDIKCTPIKSFDIQNIKTRSFSPEIEKNVQIKQCDKVNSLSPINEFSDALAFLLEGDKKPPPSKNNSDSMLRPKTPDILNIPLEENVKFKCFEDGSANNNLHEKLRVITSEDHSQLETNSSEIENVSDSSTMEMIKNTKCLPIKSSLDIQNVKTKPISPETEKNVEVKQCDKINNIAPINAFSDASASLLEDKKPLSSNSNSNSIIQSKNLDTFNTSLEENVKFNCFEEGSDNSNPQEARIISIEDYSQMESSSSVTENVNSSAIATTEMLKSMPTEPSLDIQSVKTKSFSPETGKNIEVNNEFSDVSKPVLERDKKSSSSNSNNDSLIQPKRPDILSMSAKESVKFKYFEEGAANNYQQEETKIISSEDCLQMEASSKLSKSGLSLSQAALCQPNNCNKASGSTTENMGGLSVAALNDISSNDIKQETLENIKLMPIKSSFGIQSVKMKSFSPETMKQFEVKHCGNGITAINEFPDPCPTLQDENKKLPLENNDKSLAVSPVSDMPGLSVEESEKPQSFEKEQLDGYQYEEKQRRKSSEVFSQAEKLKNISVCSDSINETEVTVGTAILSETMKNNHLYEERNICDLDEVINQFRHKNNPVNSESYSKLDKRKDPLDKFNAKKSVSDRRKNSGKNVERSNLQLSDECKKETRAITDIQNKNLEDASVSLYKHETKISKCPTSQNNEKGQNSETVLLEGDLVNFRDVAGTQEEPISLEQQNGSNKKIYNVTKDMETTDSTNNSSLSMDTKKERMPELKPETLKSLIADLSLNKSTTDVGCSTVEDWTKKDTSKAETDWLKEKKKLISRISNLHQTQNATKFIVKELIYLVTSWMEGKDKDNTDLQETRQKLINERDQALEDLRSVEESFYELHRRYEKTKKLIEDYKKNEDILKRQIAESEEKLQQQKQMFDHLVKHSEDKLEQANAEILNLGKSKESEMAVLKAQLRKAEMKATSLDKALEQKVRENTELSSICEDLITKCGRK